MAKLTELKAIIDEELIDLHVTDELIAKTLKRAHRRPVQFLKTFKIHFMQFATLFSTIVIMLSLSVNFFGNVNKPKTSSVKIANLNSPCQNNNSDLKQLDFQITNCSDTDSTEG